ncbi:hypothetical protein L218DRAFT_882273, partial [Marasmius fiardii PR-910]
DAKFPGQNDTGIPPSPTTENPGQVYPQTDPIPGTGSPQPPKSAQALLGNPFLMRDALHKLNSALGNVIKIIEEEERYQGGTQQEEGLLSKFQTWQNELDEIRAGIQTPERSRSRVRPEHEGGMFTD